MSSAWFLSVLLQTTLASSAAIALVLALRRAVRRWLGASAAYLLWLMVPAALLAAMSPAPRSKVVGMSLVGAPEQVGKIVLETNAALSNIGIWWIALWALGALLTAAWQFHRQHQFVRGLGHLTYRADGYWQAQRVVGLPAVIGLLRPKIVLPAGFEQRYNVQEQRLVLLHEQVHLRRGDIVVNAGLALMQCIYWFNPLLMLALRRCREDQELSCDERVIARSAGGRRSYGDAMLKTGLASSSLPVGCHWENHHPLKERIAMLKRPVPGKKQWAAMLMLSLGMSSGVGYTAWAARPAQAVKAEQAATSVKSADITAINMAPPEYPKAAFDSSIIGKVVLRIEVSAEGKVTDVQVKESQPQGVFDAAAVAAAQKWTFTPKQKDGKAAAGAIDVPVWFDLDNKTQHNEQNAEG